MIEDLTCLARQWKWTVCTLTASIGLLNFDTKPLHHVLSLLAAAVHILRQRAADHLREGQVVQSVALVFD